MKIFSENAIKEVSLFLFARKKKWFHFPLVQYKKVSFSLFLEEPGGGEGEGGGWVKDEYEMWSSLAILSLIKKNKDQLHAAIYI